MPLPFEKKYSATQWEAIFAQRIDRGTPARRIAEMAASGELTGEPFEINTRYLYERCRQEVKRRQGKLDSKLADMPHREAVEILRRRMISAADALSRQYEALAQKTPADVDPERGRQIVRLLREAAAMPTQKAEAPAKPGAKINGRQSEGPTRGALMAAFRSNGDAEPSTSEEEAEAETGARESASATQLAA